MWLLKYIIFIYLLYSLVLKWVISVLEKYWNCTGNSFFNSVGTLSVFIIYP